MFKETIKTKFTQSFDSWTTDRRTVNTGAESQFSKGSSPINIAPKFLNAAQQTETRARTANKADNIASFNLFDVRKKYFAKIDEIRCPIDSIDVE